MIGYIWAIYSNSGGHPYTGWGRVGHIVVATNDPNIPVVLELNDGGHYPNYDCAVASTRSELRANGLPDPGAVAVEIDEKTQPPIGTLFTNMLPALDELGLSHGGITYGNPPASANVIMNPMFGREARTSAYDAASQGAYIPVYGAKAQQAGSTQQTGGTLLAEANKEDDYMTGNIVRCRIKDANGNVVGEDIYELNKAGDVWWKHLDANGKELVNSRIGQNGSLNHAEAGSWATGLVFEDGLELTPTETVVGDVEELTGTRASDGQVWRMLHAAGSQGFGGGEIV